MSAKLSFDLVEREMRKRNFAVLSTISQDGKPHSTGVMYAVSSRKKPLALYVTTNRTNKKAHNIKLNPNVAFVIPLNRRLLRFLPPHCIQFQGKAEIIPIEDEVARDAFNSSVMLQEVLKLEETHVGPKAVFLRITPDPVVHTYGLGFSFFELSRNIGSAASRVEIPSSRLSA